MGITNHPQVGSIIRVDYSEGFRLPEMVKRRPAIVISPPLEGRQQLCTVVPLSTTAPKTARSYHYLLELDPPLPYPFEERRMWVKADMVATVAFHRLAWLHRGNDESGKRIYDIRVLDRWQIDDIRHCVAVALGIRD